MSALGLERTRLMIMILLSSPWKLTKENGKRLRVDLSQQHPLCTTAKSIGTQETEHNAGGSKVCSTLRCLSGS